MWLPKVLAWVQHLKTQDSMQLAYKDNLMTGNVRRHSLPKLLSNSSSIALAALWDISGQIFVPVYQVGSSILCILLLRDSSLLV